MDRREGVIIFFCLVIFVHVRCKDMNDSKIAKMLTADLKGIKEAHIDNSEDNLQLCPEGCNCTFITQNLTTIVRCRNYTRKMLPDKLPGRKNYSLYLDFDGSFLGGIHYRPYLWITIKASFRHNNIKEVSFTALQSLYNTETLNFDDNVLKRLPRNVSKIIFPVMKHLLLGKNQWDCGCQSLPTKDWIMVHTDMIKDKNLIICRSPPNMAGYNMVAMSRDLFCPKVPSYKMTYIIVCAATGGNILLMIICIIPCFISKKRFWVYKKTKWHPMDRDECNDEGKEFDIFVSYANEDSDYIEEYLIPELQKHGFKICYHRVNFHGGKPITVNIAECIEKSKRTLVFFSRFFTESEFCMWEFSVALEMDLKDKTHRLVTIKQEDLDTDDLDITSRSYFKRFTFISQEAQDFWDHLIYTLPLNRLGSAFVSIGERD